MVYERRTVQTNSSFGKEQSSFFFVLKARHCSESLAFLKGQLDLSNCSLIVFQAILDENRILVTIIVGNYSFFLF